MHDDDMIPSPGLHRPLDRVDRVHVNRRSMYPFPRLDKIQNLVEKPIACLNGKPIRDLENSSLTRYGGKYHFFVDQIPTDHVV